jgi:hypothetical protein
MSPAFSPTRCAISTRRKAKRDYWSPPQGSAFLGGGSFAVICHHLNRVALLLKADIRERAHVRPLGSNSVLKAAQQLHSIQSPR